jgi:hypothetical protein
MVVIHYTDLEALNEYRRALDKILDDSQVKKLTIIVTLPKDVNKDTLPPHFLIYYNSPNDYTFMGKLKDVLLQRELEKPFDMLLWVGSLEQKVYQEIKSCSFKQKVVVNDVDDGFFDLELKSKDENAFTLLDFVVGTLDKIELI